MVTVVEVESCSSCRALKAYLGGAMKNKIGKEIIFKTIDEFGYDKLRQFGNINLPTIISSDGAVYAFTDLLKTADFIKTKLQID